MPSHSELYWPYIGGAELATHLIVGLLKEFFNVSVVTGFENMVKHENVEYIYEPSLSNWKKTLHLA